MSRLRKIYKGEQPWNVLNDEYEDILGKNKNNDKENKTVNNPVLNKIFQEDKINVNRKTIPLGNFSNIGENKQNEQNEIFNKEDNEAQDFAFENILENNNDNNNIQLTDKDLLQFEQNFDMQSIENKSIKNDNNIHYEREKRNYSEAFATSLYGDDDSSLVEDHNHMIKKSKIN